MKLFNFEPIRCPKCGALMEFNDFNGCYECPRCGFWIPW